MHDKECNSFIIAVLRVLMYLQNTSPEERTTALTHCYDVGLTPVLRFFWNRVADGAE